MSVHVSAEVWKMKVGDPEAKLVLLKLADNANDDGIAWPSQRTLASQCEVSQTTVSRRINYLIDQGLLLIEKPGNPNRSTVYKVLTTTVLLRDSGVNHDESRANQQGNRSDSPRENQNRQETSSKRQGCEHETCAGRERCAFDYSDAAPPPVDFLERMKKRSAA